MNQRRAETVLFLVLVDYLQSVNGFENCPSPRPSRGREGSESPSVVKGAGEASGLDPLHPCRERWSLLPRQGAESSSLRSCGPHQPLDPPYACRRCSEKDPAEARSDESYVRVTDLLCHR